MIRLKIGKNIFLTIELFNIVDEVLIFFVNDQYNCKTTFSIYFYFPFNNNLSTFVHCLERENKFRKKISKVNISNN